MTQLMERPPQPPSSNGENNKQQQSSHAMTMNVGKRGIEIRGFADLWSMSQLLIRAGMAPKGFETPEKCAIAIEHALELGMPILAGLQSIAVVNGRPSIYGDAALALVRGSGLCDYFLELATDDAVHALVLQLSAAMELDDAEDVKQTRKAIAVASAKVNRDSDAYGYTVISKRAGAVVAMTTRFTTADAKKARLWGKDGPWSQYPERMLKFRARGFNLRDNFGDVLKGMTTVEEAGDMPPRVAPSITIGSRAVIDNFNQNTGEVVGAGAPGTAADPFPDTQLPEQELRQRTAAVTETTAVPSPAQTMAPTQAPATDGGPLQPNPESVAVIDAEEAAKIQWGEFVEELTGIAVSNGWQPGGFNGALKKYFVAKKMVGKEHTLGDAERANLREAVKEGRGYFAPPK